jgi:hypothetical protein
MSVITNNLSGSSSGGSRVGITGSVIIANVPGSSFPSMPGTDTTFFVSGSSSEKSVFGGDLVISGSSTSHGGAIIAGDLFEITGTLAVTAGISGSLTKLADGTSYLVAGANVSISSASNGSITISAPTGGGPGGSSGQVQFNDGGVFGGSSSLTFDKVTGALTSSIVDVSSYLKLQSTNVTLSSDHTAGYMYVSGSTNDIYFTQYQPITNLTNTTRLRWLEGQLTTGLLHGGLLSTQGGTTTFSLTSGSGIIVSYNASVGSEPYPTVKYVTWPAILSQSLNYVTSSILTYIGINDSGGIIQQTSPFSLTADSQYITIGRVLHQSGSVTNGVGTQPIVGYGTNHWQDDFTRAFGPLKVSGHILAASSSAGVGTLGLTKTAGDSYVQGRNYAVDPNNPNNVTSVSDTGLVNSKIYRTYVSGSTVKIDTGVANVGNPTIDPGFWNDNGTLNSVSSGQFSIQRAYWFPNSANKALYVYYGQATYATLDLAQQNLAAEAFTEGENTSGGAILVGYILVKGNATDLTNSSQARIIQAGISRGAGAGGGGGVAVGATTPGGLDTYVQFNDGGSTFGGNSGLTYNKSTQVLTIGNTSIGDTGVESTTGTTFTLVNTNATTVNFAGGASTAINMGNATGTNTVLGTTKFSQGISGSHTTLTDGTSYLIAGNNVTITTGSNGAVTIGASSVVPTSTTITAGTGLTGGGDLSTNRTLSINDSVVATISGSTFTGVTKHNAGLSGSHTKLTDGTSAFIAGSNASIVTGSNGAVTFAAVPAGSTTQVQFNDGGSFAGSAGFTYDKTTTSLNVTGDITGSNLRLTGDAAVVGGDLTSTSTTFNLVNSSVTTVNIGGGASTINIGGSTTTGSLSGDLSVSGRSNLGTAVENILTSNGGTGTVAFSMSSQSVFYAKAPTGNITANFTSVPATTNKVISTTVILSQSSPAYIVNAVQIDGVAQTLNWVNGTTPSGTANKHDVFGFSLIRSGSTPTWVVLGQMSTYG